MNLQLYVYNCGNCGNAFKLPEFSGDLYGEFLMRSATGEIVYLSSFTDAVFQEVEELFDKNKVLEDMDKMTRAKIFHKVFGVVCDPASDNSNYQIGRDPLCPNCRSNTSLSWHPTNPPELIDIQVSSATHNEWNKLNGARKREILDNEIQSLLNNMEIF